MADFPAETPSNLGAALTTRTGTTNADTLPAGSVVVARNAGAGAHTMTLTVGAQFDGLAVSSRVHTVAAGGVYAFRVPAAYGDANGRVPLAINGTASEVTYHILGV
ncbi:hypothetical protein C1I95_14725 [Micromonospora craterilacus]|uniref:Uncharacterized protein n=1 Tax=Micromonospora craterilacus TaxID=1655439 RepID=A0A2W2E634_9ACTN|nr:hypothetical protein [Micromonospora craterilacus]PZG17801.1 hypothetical protein C1I95_14725 [Micromonospora craterilacus]